MLIDQPPAKQPTAPAPAEPHELGAPTPPRPACDCRKLGVFCYHAMCEALAEMERDSVAGVGQV